MPRAAPPITTGRAMRAIIVVKVVFFMSVLLCALAFRFLRRCVPAMTQECRHTRALYVGRSASAPEESHVPRSGEPRSRDCGEIAIRQDSRSPRRLDVHKQGATRQGPPRG